MNREQMLAEMLRKILALDQHAYTCAVARHYAYAREAQIGRVRRGRGATTDAARWERARREAHEYAAQKPACDCIMAEARALLGD